MKRQLKSESVEPTRAQEAENVDDGDPFREFGSLTDSHENEGPDEMAR